MAATSQKNWQQELQHFIQLTQKYLFQNYPKAFLSQLPPKASIQRHHSNTEKLNLPKTPLKNSDLPSLEKPYLFPKTITPKENKSLQPQKHPLKEFSAPIDTFSDITALVETHFPKQKILKSVPKPLPKEEVYLITATLDPLEHTFYQTLKNAIETRLKKTVNLISKEDWTAAPPSCSIKLLLIPADLIVESPAPFMTLEPASVYKQSPDKKKELWSNIQRILTKTP